MKKKRTINALMKMSLGEFMSTFEHVVVSSKDKKNIDAILFSNNEDINDQYMDIKY